MRTNYWKQLTVILRRATWSRVGRVNWIIFLSRDSHVALSAYFLALVPAFSDIANVTGDVRLRQEAISLPYTASRYTLSVDDNFHSKSLAGIMAMHVTCGALCGCHPSR